MSEESEAQRRSIRHEHYNPHGVFFSVLAIRYTAHCGMLLGIPRGPGCKMKAGYFKVGLAK